VGGTHGVDGDGRRRQRIRMAGDDGSSGGGGVRRRRGKGVGYDGGAGGEAACGGGSEGVRGRRMEP
jgi:hypothetical protein